jgi:YHS domain-containing protein
MIGAPHYLKKEPDMQRRSRNRWILGTAFLALVTALPPVGAEAQAKAKVIGDAYPLDRCIVTGEKLGSMGKPVVMIHEGREIRFCCSMCVRKFRSDTAGYFKKLDAAIIKQEKAAYPLATCIVDGKPLKRDDHAAVDHVFYNRYVRLCCPECLRKFQKEPRKYLKRLDAAVIKAQLKQYPLDTCVVSGEKLGGMGDPVNYVHANRLIRFCCAGCIKPFRKDPAKYMAKLRSKHKPAHGGDHEAHPGGGHEGHQRDGR